jgi:hypothetical protein
MLWESCSSSYTEHNKIEFAFFGFFCNFIWFFKVTAEAQQGVKIILRRNPWNFLSLTRLPSTLAARPSNPKNFPQGYPRRRRRLAGSDVGPTQVNMWHGGTIELTLSRLAVVAWPAVSPASGGDRPVVARPRALELRRGQGRSWSTCGTGSFSGT